MALRFLCVTLGLNVDLPRDYWEEDCRWLIVNLQYEDAKELIEKEDLKVDVNAKVGYSDKSLFHMAAERGRVDLVRSMIKHRAVKINHTNKDGYTALHFAIYYDYPQVVVTLLEYGADVNKPLHDGWTALMAGATAGHEETVRRHARCAPNMLLHHAWHSPGRP